MSKVSFTAKIKNGGCFIFFSTFYFSIKSHSDTKWDPAIVASFFGTPFKANHLRKCHLKKYSEFLINWLKKSDPSYNIFICCISELNFTAVMAVTVFARGQKALYSCRTTAMVASAPGRTDILHVNCMSVVLTALYICSNNAHLHSQKHRPVSIPLPCDITLKCLTGFCVLSLL